MANELHTLKIGSTEYPLDPKTCNGVIYTGQTGTTFSSYNTTPVDCNNATGNGHWYWSANGPSTTIGADWTDGALYSTAYSSLWVAQISQGFRNGRLFTRAKNNGTWTAWEPIAYKSDIPAIPNYTLRVSSTIGKFYLQKDGADHSNITINLPTNLSQFTNDSGFITASDNITGSSGSCTGNASSASSVPWTGVTGRPTNLSQFVNDLGFISGSPNSLEMTGVAGQKTPFIDFHHYDTVGNDYDYRIICSGAGSEGVGSTKNGKGVCTFEGNSRFKGNIQPYTGNTYSLGNSTYKWANVYATTFTGNLTGNVTGNVTGNCSGSSGSCTGNAATATTATTATSLNLGENCYIKRYASPYQDGASDSIQIHGYYSVDIDSEFFVDSPYNARIRGGNEGNGGIGELTLSKDEAKFGHQIPSTDSSSYIEAAGADITIRGENSVEYSQLMVTPKRILLTGGSEGISLGGTLCTVPSGMTFRPSAAGNTTYLGDSSRYWTYGYITNGYITTVRSTTAYSSNGFYESSDERLKNFGNRIPIDLDKISRLKKHYFEWKNEKESGIQIGVSAQEIKELYPELVKENEDGYLTVAYDKLSVVALAAIDELHEKNKELEGRIAKLEAIVNKLIDNE